MTTEDMQAKLKYFASVLEAGQLAQLKARGWDCQGNRDSCKVSIVPGNKYVKVDVGSSGKYMVDADGNIWGIKGYGVIHRGHQYGTLDTVDSFDWAHYQAVRKE